MISNARTFVVAGLAVGAYLGTTAPVPAEEVLPTRIAVGAFLTRGPHHAAGSCSTLSPAADRYFRAKRPLEHAVGSDARVHEREHPGLTVSLNQLATLYWTTGRHAKAELLFKRAIAIDEMAHGCDHPGLATSLDNLAGLYQATGRRDAAEPLLERAVAIDVKAHGRHHPNLASRLNNLAVLYWATSRQNAAEALFARALAFSRKVFRRGTRALRPSARTTSNSSSSLAAGEEISKWRTRTEAIRHRCEAPHDQPDEDERRAGQGHEH